MPAQFLARYPRTRNAKSYTRQKSSVVTNCSGSQDSLDFSFVDWFGLPPFVALNELDWRLGQTEAAISTPSLGYGILITKVPCKFARQAAICGEEVDNTAYSRHIALLSRFNLRIDRRDNSLLGNFSLWEVSQDAKPIDDTARLKLYSTAIILFLQLPNPI